MLSEKYGASVEICILLTQTAPDKKNHLGTPYSGGYPDLNPVRMFLHNLAICSYDELHYIGILMSLGATCKQVYYYVAKHCGAKEFTLRLVTVRLHSSHEPTQGTLVPESADPLFIAGFEPNSEIVVVPLSLLTKQTFSGMAFL